MSEVIGKITKIVQQHIKIDGVAFPFESITLYANVLKHHYVGETVKVELRKDGTVKNVVSWKGVNDEQKD